MLDFPLQLLIGIVATLIFRQRGDRLWIAVVKGVLVSFAVTFVLSLILWITSWTLRGSVARKTRSRSPSTTTPIWNRDHSLSTGTCYGFGSVALRARRRAGIMAGEDSRSSIG